MQVGFQVFVIQVFIVGVYMCECSCQVSSHGVEESDDTREETVLQSDRDGPNASVPSSGWQKGVWGR